MASAIGTQVKNMVLAAELSDHNGHNKPTALNDATEAGPEKVWHTGLHSFSLFCLTDEQARDKGVTSSETRRRDEKINCYHCRARRPVPPLRCLYMLCTAYTQENIHQSYPPALGTGSGQPGTLQTTTAASHSPP